MVRLFVVLAFLAIFPASSQLQVHTFVFDEPIDGLSVRLPHDNTDVAVLTNEGWDALTIEKEFDPLMMESELVMFPDERTHVSLRGDIENLELHPIRVSKEPVSYQLAAETFYRAPRILSRADWGANDAFLYKGPSVTRSDETPTGDNGDSGSTQAVSKRVQDCELAVKNYPQDFRTSSTTTQSPDGKEYRWPQKYSPDVKLLVVHHTAMKISGDTRPAAERVRALYEYHANNRGWGDIGYNYLIDEDGMIYEGRAGGKNVVAGHAYCANVGTLGIALLGNFDMEQPAMDQVHALQWLLDHLAGVYDIDLKKTVMFQGKNLQPIVRHKDLLSTDCPGYYMSSAITQVRTNVAAGNLDADVSFPALLVKEGYVDKVSDRLAARIEKVSETMGRSFYRAKRLVRTAARLSPANTRLQHYKDQLENTSDLQKRRESRITTRRTPTPTTPTPDSKSPASSDKTIRIRLSHQGSVAQIAPESSASIDGKSVAALRLGKEGDACVALDNGTEVGRGVVRMDPGNGILKVTSWNTRLNRFRGIIECRVVNGELALINELSMEAYLAGLAEEPDTEPYEKQRAFAIAARSYAAFYTDPAHRKFPGLPYDGSDSPAVFQMYGGVVFEEENPSWVRAVESTSGKVIMMNGSVVKTPYFSSDDGRTRTPAENGWKNFPFAEVFSSKPDPWCKGETLRGHGVGMSGCGAEGQAKEGKTAEEILGYYYPSTSISSW